MRISLVAAVERIFPDNLLRRVLPVAQAIDSILYNKDDRAVSRRIALITFTVRILSGVIAYISQVLLARWMGDFEYGVFVIVWVGAVIVGSLACLGIQTAILRFVPEYTQRGDVQLVRGVIVGSRIQGFVGATILAIVGACGLYFFGDHLEGYYLIPLYLGAVVLPMMALSEIQDNLSRAFNWADLTLWPTFIVRPVLILLIMWLAVDFGWKPNAVTGMAAVIIATYLTSIGQLISLARRMRKAVPAGPRAYAPAQWMAIALPIFLVEGFFNLLTNVDIIMVGHFMPPDQVGVYYAAAKTLVLVHFVYYAVKSGQRPALLAVLCQRRPHQARRVHARYAALDLLAFAWHGDFPAHLRASAAVAVRREFCRRLSAPVHPHGRHPGARFDRTGGDAADDGRAAEDRRRRLHADVRVLRHSQHRPHPALRPRRRGERHVAGADCGNDRALLHRCGAPRHPLLDLRCARAAAFGAGAGGLEMSAGGIIDTAIRSARRAPPARGPAMEFAITPLDGAMALLPEWSALSGHAAGDNLFFHPDFALPAMRHLGADVLLATVRHSDRRLAALAPFTRARLGRVAPAARLWAHDYAPLGLPLVDEEAVATATAALLDGLAPAGSGTSVIAADLPMESSVAKGLVAAALRQSRPVDILDGHVRATLVRSEAGATDPRAALPPKRRHEVGRQLRRLADVGEVTFVSAIEPQQVRARFELFMQLEAAGWKGKRGTALLSNPATAEFAREVVANRAEAGAARVGLNRPRRQADRDAGDVRCRLYRLHLEGRLRRGAIALLAGRSVDAGYSEGAVLRSDADADRLLRQRRSSDDRLALARSARRRHPDHRAAGRQRAAPHRARRGARRAFRARNAEASPRVGLDCPSAFPAKAGIQVRSESASGAPVEIPGPPLSRGKRRTG